MKHKSNPKEIIENIQKRVSEEIEKKNRGGYTPVDYKGVKRILDRLNTRPRFIIELIQNADDNNYDVSDPSLEIYIINYGEKGYPYCLWILNNEMGFRKENVEKLCQFFGSTKRKVGFIGEFGVGFKSVFSITNDPYIYSNGFSFKFHYEKEEPLTLIRPLWVDSPPEFIKREYTNIILPFAEEEKKVKEVLGQVNQMSPPLLLFLKNIKIIKVENKVTNESMYFKKEKKRNEIWVLHNSNEQRWRVVKKQMTIPTELKVYLKNQMMKEVDVDTTEIILAFPLENSGNSKTSEEQFVFAFLPINKYGFKFIIQADFLLTGDREDIKKDDNRWNMWLRDSIIGVFLDAVREFKNDENLKYNFYNYLPLKEEIKDDFFLPVVEQIYGKLKEEACILTKTNNWKRPSEVLIGDDEIKEIVTNEDLQKFFGKEYLSDTIKAKRQVLQKLGVNDFSIDDLIKCLENKEWIENKNEEWFAKLFNYLSKKKLSDEHLERLRSLEIIKLENGELTSINKGAVFFPLERKAVYGFEDELRIIKRDIIDTISKRKKEERDKIISEFLQRLGLKQAHPYEIIEDHILPVYESEDWKQKDSRTLIGYVMYIKDNTDKYERESDRRLNANKASWETKEDPLKRLKKSLRIRINKDDEGEKQYNYPENVYLPRSYGNENDLETLFEGIDVSFAHFCYLEQELKRIDNEILELKNKIQGKSKKWKKKHRKEVKKIEKKIIDLKEEKEKKIREWRDFFLKMGVDSGLRVIRCDGSYLSADKKEKLRRSNTYYSSRYNPSWDYTSQEIEDYTIEFLDRILNRGEKSKMIHLLRLLQKQWSEISKYKDLTYKWQYYAWYSAHTDSTWVHLLKSTSWLPTTQNTLAKPSEVFLDKPEIREVLGDTVPYLAVKIENEDFIRTLGINTQANVGGVLNYLKVLVKQESKDKEKFERLYRFLDEHFEEDATKIKEAFKQNSLIFIPDTDKNYYSGGEVIWKDVSNIFGKNRIYLEKYYSKFRRFFVEKIGISEKPTPKDYADVLYSISEKSHISDEDKKIIIRIYEELNRNLNPDPDKIENPISKEDWWNDFIKKSIFLINKGDFWSNGGDIFINDNNELYELFKDEENIGFLWLPDGYHPDKIKFFIKACDLHYLSENVEIEPLVEKTTFSKDDKRTKLIQDIIPYVLRYLYWEENEEYEKLKEKSVLEKLEKLKFMLLTIWE